MAVPMPLEFENRYLKTLSNYHPVYRLSRDIHLSSKSTYYVLPNYKGAVLL